MIFTLRTASILYLLVSFVWCVGTDSPLSIESNGKNENNNKNSSIDIGISTNKFQSEVTSKEPHSEEAVETTHLKLATENTEDEKSFESQPESSLSNHLESESPEIPDSDSSSIISEEESEDVVFNSTQVSMIATPEIEDLVGVTSNESCPFGSRRCKLSQIDPTNVEDQAKDKEVPTVLVLPTSPLWNVVKSLKSLREDFTRIKSRMLTSSRRMFLVSPTVTLSSTSTSATTPVETSDNVIAIDTTDLRKEEDNIALDNAKNEKTKSTKSTDEVQPPVEKFPRSSLKITMTSLEPSKSTSFVDMQPVSSTFTTETEDLVSSANNWNATSSDIPTILKDHVFQPDYSKLKIVNASSSVENNISNELNSTSVLLPSDLKFNVTLVQSTPIISESTTLFGLGLSPSFGDYSSTVMIRSVEDIGSTTYSTTETAVVDLFEPTLGSSLQPKNDREQIVRDGNRGSSVFPTIPRLTNPSCSTLPMCVEITLLQTTWDQFCSQMQDFQSFLSKIVAQYVRQVQARHIVLDAESCSSSIRPVQSTPDVSVAFYVTDETGEYEERLTEICGLILRKWAPTSYRDSVVEVRLHTGEIQATPLPPIPEMSSGFAAAVSISVIAGIALCLLCILLLVMRQKLALQSRTPDNATPDGPDAYSLDSLSISASFRRRRNRRSYLNHAFSDHEIPSHPLNDKTLANCLKNKDLLEEEFRKIPMNMPKLDSIPDGAHVKNRYSNILPRPESRVVLSVPSGDDLQCYINANFVKGYGGKPRVYVACQAPLPEGIADFWRMVWEQQTKLIVMLTLFEENGVSRCAVYFPQSTLMTPPPFGDYQVTVVKKEVYEFYTVSTLRILDMEKNLFREVSHLWYTGWPDVGVPKDPATLSTFVQQCRTHMARSNVPAIVHCSTGTGRTGVFLTLDMCMREFEESGSLDVLRCVCLLRKDRAGAVQNKDQYILIHEALMDYVSRMGNGHSHRSSISSKTP